MCVHTGDCAKFFSCMNIQTSKIFGKKKGVSVTIHPHALLGGKIFIMLTRMPLTEEKQ